MKRIGLGCRRGCCELVRGDEFEVAAAEHGGRIAPHNGACLHQKVAQQGARVPTANEADAVGINAGAQQSHGACIFEGAGTNIAFADAEIVAVSASLCPFMRCSLIGRQGRCWCAAVRTEQE